LELFMSNILPQQQKVWVKHRGKKKVYDWQIPFCKAKGFCKTEKRNRIEKVLSIPQFLRKGKEVRLGCHRWPVLLF
jgi:hypothetical protein